MQLGCRVFETVSKDIEGTWINLDTFNVCSKMFAKIFVRNIQVVFAFTLAILDVVFPKISLNVRHLFRSLLFDELKLFLII